MRSSKANAFVLYLGVFVFALWLSGCGGGGSLGGSSTPPSPTVSSVALSGVAASLQVGATAQAACTVTMSDGTTNSNCTFASDNAAVATVGATSGTVTAIAAGTTHLTATSTKDSTKSSSPFTLTVTAVPVTVTSVTVTATPSAITTAQTAQCTATVAGTGAFSSAVAWTATSGTIADGGNGTATLTPSGAGTATCTATSAQAGYTTVSGSANVTVTRATPTITSATIQGLPWVFCSISCNKATLGFLLTGTGFKAGDQISFSGYWPTTTLTSAQISADGTQVGLEEVVGDNQHPNFIYFTDTPTDGTSVSNTVAFAYVAGYNTATHGPSGNLINQYMGKAYVWQNASGTWTSPLSFTGGGGGANTVYETDGTNAYLVNGFNPYTLDGTGLPSATSTGWAVSGTSAENGTVTVVQPGGNKITLYRPSATTTPIANDIPVGTMPYTSVMATVGGTTYAFVASVD